MVCVNRTPVCANVVVRRDEGSDYAIFGCRLRHRFAAGRKDAGEFQVLVNVITPYVPLTSSGKDPDLLPMLDEITGGTRKGHSGGEADAHQDQRDEAQSEEHHPRPHRSGGRETERRRQVLVLLAPALLRTSARTSSRRLGREPQYGTFSRIVGEYEDECGDIEHLYRDDRGTLYHPHTRRDHSTRHALRRRLPAPGVHIPLAAVLREGRAVPNAEAREAGRSSSTVRCAARRASPPGRARALIRLLKESPELIMVVCHS